MFLYLSFSLLPLSKNKINNFFLKDELLHSRKKELLPFATAWMELESIILSEISQAVRDKYHMISPISRT